MKGWKLFKSQQKNILHIFCEYFAIFQSHFQKYNYGSYSFLNENSKHDWHKHLTYCIHIWSIPHCCPPSLNEVVFFLHWMKLLEHHAAHWMQENGQIYFQNYKVPVYLILLRLFREAVDELQDYKAVDNWFCVAIIWYDLIGYTVDITIIYIAYTHVLINLVLFPNIGFCVYLSQWGKDYWSTMLWFCCRLISCKLHADSRMMMNRMQYAWNSGQGSQNVFSRFKCPCKLIVIKHFHTLMYKYIVPKK